jgi:hypothetical protein
MKSKLAKKILSETSEETKRKARDYGNFLIKEKIVDKFAHYVMTGSAVVILFVTIGLIIDNLRVVFNILIIMVSILFLGFLFY